MRISILNYIPHPGQISSQEGILHHHNTQKLLATSFAVVTGAWDMQKCTEGRRPGFCSEQRLLTFPLQEEQAVPAA